MKLTLKLPLLQSPLFTFLPAMAVLSAVCLGQTATTQTTSPKPTQDADGLVQSAGNGDLGSVQSILAAGVDVNAKSKDGETALAAAAAFYNASYEIVELLLARGARVDDRSLGFSAIWVDLGFGLEEPTTSYSFPCGESMRDTIERYSKADHVGVTPLLAAASAGESKIVELLLDRGADIKARTFEGITPLMLATHANDVASMRALLLKGADVNARAGKGQTALMIASWSGGSDIGARRMEAIRLLMDSGAVVNAQDQSGRSALIGAAEADNRAAARFLLRNGAELAGRNKAGKTALIQAAHEGNLEMLRLLSTAGADVNAKDLKGRTALMEAASIYMKSEVKPAVVRLLIEKGADPNARDSIGETALMDASSRGSTRVARLLIESGADVNAKSDDGITALINAAWRGHLEVVRLLIERGADVNAQAKSGITALERSYFGGEDSAVIARLLKAAGATR